MQEHGYCESLEISIATLQAIPSGAHYYDQLLLDSGHYLRASVNISEWDSKMGGVAHVTML